MKERILYWLFCIKWFFVGKPKITPQEIADILREALDTFPEPERQAKADWALAIMEKMERQEEPPVAQHVQNIRAELFRNGVKHTNQQ